MESPITSKAMVSSSVGKGSSTSNRPSGGIRQYSGSITAPAPTRPIIGTQLSRKYSEIGSISEALISLIPEKISETAPGRTPMAAARPPLDLPVFFSPRSIIFASIITGMAIPLSDFQYIPNFVSEINAGFQKNDLTSYSDYRNKEGRVLACEQTETRQVELAVWPP